MTLAAATQNRTNDRTLLAKALFNAADAMGVAKADVSKIVGRDRTGITRDGIDPQSKAGELALMFVRVYRGLYALVGGDRDNMRHWLTTDNEYFGQAPLQAMKTCEGLVRVVMYLDAIRGKV